MDSKDDLLIRQCLEKNEEAWTEIVQSHTSRIYSLSCSFTRRPDEAEELTQEIFVRVFQRLHSYRIGLSSFRYWLHQLARNLLIDHYRSTWRQRQASIGQLDAANLVDVRTPDPLQLLERAEAARVLRRALLSLSARSREAIVLRELDGLGYGEVAAILGVPEGTVKSRVNRARAKLARLLSQESRARLSPSTSTPAPEGA